MLADLTVKLNPKETVCVDCGKIQRRMLFVCPSCKTSRCFNCWATHLDAKVCSYGKADKLNVAI